MSENLERFNKAYYKVCSGFNSVSWAKERLNGLSEMLDKDEPHISFPPRIEWIKKEVDEINQGINGEQESCEIINKIVKEIILKFETKESVPVLEHEKIVRKETKAWKKNFEAMQDAFNKELNKRLSLEKELKELGLSEKKVVSNDKKER